MERTQLVARIQQVHQERKMELPSLPDIILSIRDAINDERKGISHIARLIQLDPMLTARLLKVANSPLYHSGTAQSDLRTAVQRLGLTTTRNLVMCLVINNVFNVKTYNMRKRIKRLWEHSSQVGAIAQVLARTIRGISPDKALLAGLLHDIGELPVLIYADQHPELFEDSELLEQVLQSTRGELGSEILRTWAIDGELLEVPLYADQFLRQHQGAFEYADLVILAQVHAFFGTPQAAHIPAMSAIPAFNASPFGKLGPDASLEIIHQAKHDIAMTMRLLNG